ncbi:MULTISPECIES: hypothetical protein [Gammaproteobacteria]|uniref:hypothetical protein n=1 Tax=Gammaproteobacteria TaxID=1236 RepID=UPI001ADCA210|nr:MULTISPECIES: hypothetical protein [Gammaproteobacteria]MBO9480139.1 hypothetical protein [Salinisphaera sp. G21_0]MBO9493270.1 hypothetical protein [Thalassotalea sp. G20_0]
MKKWVAGWDIPLIMVILVVEILLINAFSGPDNTPFSLSIVDAVCSIAFAFTYFHVPVPVALFLTGVLLLVPACLLTLMVRWLLSRS